MLHDEQGLPLFYPFDPSSDHWKLNEDVTISLVFPDRLDKSTATGFCATLRRYAEEACSRDAENMASRFKRYLRDTGASCVTSTTLLTGMP